MVLSEANSREAAHPVSSLNFQDSQPLNLNTSQFNLIHIITTNSIKHSHEYHSPVYAQVLPVALFVRAFCVNCCKHFRIFNNFHVLYIYRPRHQPFF
jgi:hypothetical protein